MTTYDSKSDTLKHIELFQHLMGHVFNVLLDNHYKNHDASKLKTPEKEMYDEFTPKLKELTYGSDEYKETLKAMGLALKHHYQENSHHPEHYPNGINGMSLLDLLEMLTDWVAAGKRHADSDILKSLEINKERFGISDQLYGILKNTLYELYWAVDENWFQGDKP